MKNKIFLTIGTLCCCIMLVSLLVGWEDRTGTTGTVPPSVVLSSVRKSIPLLEKSGYLFTMRSSSKCAGCHHTTLTSMVVEMAVLKGIPRVDSFAAQRIQAMESGLKFACDPNQIGSFLTINFPTSYFLMGLAAEKYAPSAYTDISVDYLMSQARPDGSFLAESGRAPLQCGDIHCTATVIRAIRLYASAAKQDRVNELTGRTRKWLEQARAEHQQELVFQLLGMYWCDSDHDQRARIADKLLSMQNGDGGWSQLPTLGSDAYATGQAMYALYQSGMLRTEDESYQKGLKYLLKTQDESGAWVVETRSYPIQPFFTTDFPPYDENQYISAAATNWSVLALLQTLPDRAK